MTHQGPELKNLKCISTKETGSVIVAQSALLVLAVVEQAQVMSGVEVQHHEKQRKPGQLVDSFLVTETWAPTSSK